MRAFLLFTYVLLGNIVFVSYLERESLRNMEEHSIVFMNARASTTKDLRKIQIISEDSLNNKKPLGSMVALFTMNKKSILFFILSNLWSKIKNLLSILPSLIARILALFSFGRIQYNTALAWFLSPNYNKFDPLFVELQNYDLDILSSYKKQCVMLAAKYPVSYLAFRSFRICQLNTHTILLVEAALY
jgi:hypothetical protein